jgi:hypothetical protein
MRTMMNQELAATWLDRYGRAWEQADPDSAASLFSEGARYFDTPFSTPFCGRNGVRSYWTNATRSQLDIRFEYSIIHVQGRRVVAQWHASYRKSDRLIQLDGIFVLSFGKSDQCSELREWWHRIDAPVS